MMDDGSLSAGKIDTGADNGDSRNFACCVCLSAKASHRTCNTCTAILCDVCLSELCRQSYREDRILNPIMRCPVCQVKFGFATTLKTEAPADTHIFECESNDCRFKGTLAAVRNHQLKCPLYQHLPVTCPFDFGLFNCYVCKRSKRFRKKMRLSTGADIDKFGWHVQQLLRAGKRTKSNEAPLCGYSDVSSIDCLHQHCWVRKAATICAQGLIANQFQQNFHTIFCYRGLQVCITVKFRKMIDIRLDNQAQNYTSMIMVMVDYDSRGADALLRCEMTVNVPLNMLPLGYGMDNGRVQQKTFEFASTDVATKKQIFVIAGGNVKQSETCKVETNTQCQQDDLTSTQKFDASTDFLISFHVTNMQTAKPPVASTNKMHLTNTVFL